MRYIIFALLWIIAGIVILVKLSNKFRNPDYGLIRLKAREKETMTDFWGCAERMSPISLPSDEEYQAMSNKEGVILLLKYLGVILLAGIIWPVTVIAMVVPYVQFRREMNK